MMTADHRLDDYAVRDFIINGYLILNPALSAAFHERVDTDIERIFREKGDVRNRIYEEVPALRQVFEDPKVQGTLKSLLGDDMVMHPHRHCHTSEPGAQPTQWHQDDVNVRHHQVRRLLVMYYPHEVTDKLGPTVILPGTHLRNAPTSRMATYVNFRTQKVLAGAAGAVVVAHYDLWHTASPHHGHRNRHMLKFIFDRVSDPTEPSWNHDPKCDLEIRRNFTHTRLEHDSSSDRYKLVALRLKLWNWLKTGQVEAGPGKSEETVITHHR